MKLPVVQDDSQPWYSQGLNFTCTQCGNCCTGGPGYVWISATEIERLSTYLKLPVQELLTRYCRKLGSRVSLKERRNRRGQYDCIFLKEKQVTIRPHGADRDITTTMRVCEIYPVRPLQCRTWPFWPENLETPDNWKHASQRCPGMDAGDRHFSIQQIHRLRDAADWPENPPTSSPPPAPEKPAATEAKDNSTGKKPAPKKK